MLDLAYGIDEAQQAADDWGFNCGPAALTAVLGKTPDEIRPYLIEFERKKYTNIKLMYAILENMGVLYEKNKDKDFPIFGLVRIQWDGEWMDPGRFWHEKLSHSHWIACDSSVDYPAIFDVNAICVGGWIPYMEWKTKLVPWLLKECEPGANGEWSITHSLEIREGA